MSNQARTSALLDAFLRAPRSVEYPRQGDVQQGQASKPRYPSEIFGENVFSLATLAQTLPKPVYADFIKQRKGRQALPKPTADAVAHAAKIWAMDRGATHFTHWFQPQTDSTAEKHDAFLSLKSVITPSGEEVSAIDLFSGSQLMQAEPDASSFPSGGMRTTFEARGYTVWDTTSPMFIRPGPNGTAILYIPSVFISYNGEVLDEKTVLLRSCEAISRAAVELLALIDPPPDGSAPYVERVHTTLGTEQEFFLLDRSVYALRPDLKMCGRTLVGRLPPRHQQLEDHYFGKMPSRVLAAISEMELELYKLGVPLKTRHNEVAPAQFEVAPIFEEAVLAIDHNLLLMDVLHKVAHRHNLKALFHEKPFAGINGSGKHCNWSLATDRGENLLDPSARPETNYKFLMVLAAVLNAVHKHGSLLRAAISSASNDHRLGANEAPPGIISVFLGEQLSEVLNSIEEGRDVKNFSRPQLTNIKLGGTVLDVKVSTLPTISRDLTDRNRTSPFAFTGNKFEFRAVGSKQSPSFPMTVLNSAVAASIREVTAALVAKKGSKPYPDEDDQLHVIRQFIKASKPVRFEGDNYSQAWVDEAKKRGLPNIEKSPAAFAQLLKDQQHKPCFAPFDNVQSPRLLIPTQDEYTYYPDQQQQQYGPPSAGTERSAASPATSQPPSSTALPASSSYQPQAVPPRYADNDFYRVSMLLDRDDPLADAAAPGAATPPESTLDMYDDDNNNNSATTANDGGDYDQRRDQQERYPYQPRFSTMTVDSDWYQQEEDQMGAMPLPPPPVPTPPAPVAFAPAHPTSAPPPMVMMAVPAMYVGQPPPQQIPSPQLSRQVTPVYQEKVPVVPVAPVHRLHNPSIESMAPSQTRDVPQSATVAGLQGSPALPIKRGGVMYRFNRWLMFKHPRLHAYRNFFIVGLLALFVAGLAVGIAIAVSRSGNSNHKANTADAGDDVVFADFGLPGLLLQGTGHATFGDPKREFVNGGCTAGEVYNDTEFVAAMSESEFEGGLEAGQDVCERCVDIVGPLGSIKARIVDKCVDCAPGDIRLSSIAYRQIADLKELRVPITWRGCGVSDEELSSVASETASTTTSAETSASEQTSPPPADTPASQPPPPPPATTPVEPPPPAQTPPPSPPPSNTDTEPSPPTEPTDSGTPTEGEEETPDETVDPTGNEEQPPTETGGATTTGGGNNNNGGGNLGGLI